MKENNIAIGIDLGTTYSCVGVYANGKVDIIANEYGNRTTPSYVAFKNNTTIVGELAKSKLSKNPKNTVYDAKRLIGSKYTNPHIQQDKLNWSFDVISDDATNNTNKPLIKVGDKTYYPEQISAFVLQKMKKIAENYLGQTVTDAVVTVPAYFNDAQRRATQDAGKIAGLNILRIINEPTAAALAYGLDKKDDTTILVYDLGGGTMDCSILEISDGMYEVRSTGGDTHLGGEDFDNIMMDWTITEFVKEHPIYTRQAIMDNAKSLTKLKKECERVKKALSSSDFATIDIESLIDGIDYTTDISKTQFETMCTTVFKRCIDPVKQVLLDAKLSTRDIDEIVLVGGSTRIPKIRDMLKKYFNKVPKNGINPDEAVAYGASIQAAMLSFKEGQDDTIDNVVLVDVIPLSLGIETAGGVMTTIIERNCPIPCTREQVFSTYSDNQPCVTVHVYEGERYLTKDNNLLGDFTLTEIPPMPRGVPKIRVTYSISSDGILEVMAVENSSKRTKRITIKNDENRFTEQELSKMIESSDCMKQNDKIIKKTVEARAQLENHIYGLKSVVSLPGVPELLTKMTLWLTQNRSTASALTFDEKTNEIKLQIATLTKKID